MFAWKTDENHIIYVILHNRLSLDWGKFILFLMLTDFFGGGEITAGTIDLGWALQ